MDGLECSEILLSKVQETYDFRTEAEFYKKEFVAIHKKLITLGAIPLTNGLSSLVTDGTHYTPNYTESGIPFLSALNVQENYLDVSAGFKYISAEQHKELSRRVLPQDKDVLLRKVGVGMRKACVVPKDTFEFSIFVSVALIRPKINPYLLSTYINSRFGQLQLLRFNKGISQPDLHLEDIGRMLVPIFSSAFVSAIESIVLSAESLLKQSEFVFGEATNILNDCLKITVNEIEGIHYSVKQYSESFESTGRLDAEYYDYKYDALFATLSEHKTMSLGGAQGLVSIKKSIEPGSEAYLEEGIPFIRVSDVDKYEISTPPIMLSKDIVPNIEDLYPKKDTILLSKDGSIGIAYKLEKDMEAITSGALLHLTVKDSNVVLPDYLTLVLNSPIVQLQAERDCNGAIIQHWKPSDIEKVLIPILDMSVQQEIASKVQESFRLRAESKRLLDLAVKTVEIAIESDEESALEWLRSKVEL